MTSILENKTPDPLRLLGIDDIDARKGHNYDTVMYNQETGKAVAIITGSKKDDVVACLRSLPIEVREGIQAVPMDMSRSFCYFVLECFPNAKPVIDRLESNILEVNNLKKYFPVLKGVFYRKVGDIKAVDVYKLQGKEGRNLWPGWRKAQRH